MELVNIALLAILFLLVRKLIWCVKWLWCYYHGQEVPDPITFLPQQTGQVFEGHIQRGRDDEED